MLRIQLFQWQHFNYNLVELILLKSFKLRILNACSVFQGRRQCLPRFAPGSCGAAQPSTANGRVVTTARGGATDRATDKLH